MPPPAVDFTSDPAGIIREQFAKSGANCDKRMQARGRAASYREMLNRRIYPGPRRVHFSKHLPESLGCLRRETDTNQQKKAADA